MAGKQPQERKSGDAVRPRVDASGARLSSLRTSGATDAPSAPTRRPKFVPKAAKRRPIEGRTGAAEASSRSTSDSQPHFSTPAPTQRDVKPSRGDLGRRGGRGGRGRGRGRGALPSGKVMFVGTLSGGSSFSGAPSTVPAKSSSSFSAADGTGISVLDEVELPGASAPDVPMEQWPPEIKSPMEPMALPLVPQPEPESTGAVFCDASGQLVLPDDTLFFLQLPTTLPLANVTSRKVKTDGEGDEAMESADEKEKQEKSEMSDDAVFDGSISTAPGGFIGKLRVHKSGKTVLLLGDKQFEVATAQTPSFCEELYAVNAHDKQLSMLGNIERHLVVTPDFDALLQ